MEVVCRGCGRAFLIAARVVPTKTVDDLRQQGAMTIMVDPYSEDERVVVKSCRYCLTQGKQWAVK